jgi:hypothetical protein
MNKEMGSKFKSLVDKCNKSYYCLMNGMLSHAVHEKSHEELSEFVDALVKESNVDSYNEGFSCQENR